VNDPVAPLDKMVPDTEHRGLVDLLPAPARPYALLARFDRPIGFWLLFWPCAWSLMLAGGEDQWTLLPWLLLGAVAMRGAGCVFNDVVDAKIDRKVARTASRPVASGAVSRTAAFAWLGVLCLVGLVVLAQLDVPARRVAICSLAPVAIYPFMKRITWWPQVWLGLVFGWGILVGWAQVRTDETLAMAALYLGTIAWIVGYDTIYALQDREDDALVGVKSSALRLGDRVKAGVAAFYAAALLLWGLMALHMAGQVVTLAPQDADNALARFRSNRDLGLVMALACWVVGNAGFS